MDDKGWRLFPAWALPAAGFVQEHKLIDGRPGNRFEPDSAVTRAEEVAVIVRLIEMQK
ncbi:S-layer homology domain-containing protein [Paenibacillus sp. 2TAB19]|uniref:S-layer homology domain-containing protein n=1 Tax=Paenibacillus sp. 2TAB19 TaxID=3233003 RepID=UPI003F95A1E7